MNLFMFFGKFFSYMKNVFKADHNISILLYLFDLFFTILTIAFNSIAIHDKKNLKICNVAKYALLVLILFNMTMTVIFVKLSEIGIVEDFFLLSLFIMIIYILLITRSITLIKKSSIFLLKFCNFIILCIMMFPIYFGPMFDYIKNNQIKQCILINISMWILIYVLDSYILKLHNKWIIIVFKMLKPAFLLMNFTVYFILLYLTSNIDDVTQINKFILIFTINVSFVTIAPEITKAFNEYSKK